MFNNNDARSIWKMMNRLSDDWSWDSSQSFSEVKFISNPSYVAKKHSVVVEGTPAEKEEAIKIEVIRDFKSPMSETHKAAISASLKNKPKCRTFLSETHKAAISASLKGVKKSEDHIAALTAAQRDRYSKSK